MHTTQTTDANQFLGSFMDVELQGPQGPSRSVRQFRLKDIGLFDYNPWGKEKPWAKSVASQQ